VVYNVDGDLLFTASKDDKPTCWYSENGERVGTYVGHSGAVGVYEGSGGGTTPATRSLV
jgi:translation initiation factor 3 subunit I